MSTEPELGIAVENSPAPVAYYADGKVVQVTTPYGPLTVVQKGDISSRHPPIITYHDIGLNYKTCFQSFFGFPDMQTSVDQFHVLHISAPGSEGHADLLQEFPTIEQLAEQIILVLKHFKIERFIGFGVGAGACILLQHAVVHPSTLVGLLLVGPISAQASWLEWFRLQRDAYTLRYTGMTPTVKSSLLSYYFSYETVSSNVDLVHTYSTELDRANSQNLAKFLVAYGRRKDVSASLRNIDCKILVVVGKESPAHDDVLETFSKFNPLYASLLEVAGVGTLVTAEKPAIFVTPLDLFFQGLSIYLR